MGTQDVIEAIRGGQLLENAGWEEISRISGKTERRER